MTSMCLSFMPEVHIAIKQYAKSHGISTKSEACASIIKLWLIEKGYYQESVEETLFNEGYENI